VRDIADVCLPAFVHRDVFHADGLLASAPVSLERLHLRREGASEFIESPLCSIAAKSAYVLASPRSPADRERISAATARRPIVYALVAAISRISGMGIFAHSSPDPNWPK